METNRPRKVREQAVDDLEAPLVELGTRKVQEQGYSLHLTIPKTAAGHLGIEAGDELEVTLNAGSDRLIIDPDEPGTEE